MRLQIIFKNDFLVLNNVNYFLYFSIYAYNNFSIFIHFFILQSTSVFLGAKLWIWLNLKNSQCISITPPKIFCFTLTVGHYFCSELSHQADFSQRALSNKLSLVHITKFSLRISAYSPLWFFNFPGYITRSRIIS